MGVTLETDCVEPEHLVFVASFDSELAGAVDEGEPGSVERQSVLPLVDCCEALDEDEEEIEPAEHLIGERKL